MAKDASILNTKEVKSVKSKSAMRWKVAWFPMALLLALSAGGLTGILGSYYLNNSRYATEVSALATYRPPQVTKIYADDGETVLAEFALEKRIPVKEKDIHMGRARPRTAARGGAGVRSHRPRGM